MLFVVINSSVATTTTYSISFNSPKNVLSSLPKNQGLKEWSLSFVSLNFEDYEKQFFFFFPLLKLEFSSKSLLIFESFLCIEEIIGKQFFAEMQYRGIFDWLVSNWGNKNPFQNLSLFFGVYSLFNNLVAILMKI